MDFFGKLLKSLGGNKETEERAASAEGEANSGIESTLEGMGVPEGVAKIAEDAIEGKAAEFVKEVEAALPDQVEDAIKNALPEGVQNALEGLTGSQPTEEKSE